MKLKLSLRDALLCIGLLLSFAWLLYAVYGTSPALPASPPETPSQPAAMREGTLQIHILDVGQGNCALLQSPSGKTMLIDAGDAEHAAAVTHFLQAQGIERLDMAVATHPHQDHIGGMSVLLRKFQPSVLLLPDAQSDLPAYSAMLQAADAIGAQILRPGVEQPIVWDEAVNVTAFAPFTGLEQLQLDVNEQSLVLHLRYGDTAILFMGDAGYSAETTLLKLLRKSSLRANVLAVGHHGASDATTPRFLRAVSPAYAVISCGAGNAYGHPHQSVLNLLAQQQVQVFRTDIQGDVHIQMDGELVAITTKKG